MDFDFCKNLLTDLIPHSQILTKGKVMTLLKATASCVVLAVAILGSAYAIDVAMDWWNEREANKAFEEAQQTIFHQSAHTVTAVPEKKAVIEVPETSMDLKVLSNRKTVTDELGKSLFDPYSAHWTFDRTKADKSGLTVFCGHVNAKNKFGAYVGARVFVAELVQSPKGPLVTGTIQTDEMPPELDIDFMNVCNSD